MDKNVVSQLLDYANKGIQKNLTSPTEVLEALQTLGITFGPVMYDEENYTFFKNVELRFNQE